MTEPWEIRTDDTRLADTLPLFIVTCEDDVSEYYYIKFFETPAIKVNAIPAAKSKMDNVLKAITHCVTEGLMTHNENGRAVLNKNDVQVWCVFDRDKEPNPAEEALGNTKFNQAIQLAVDSGIQVAWSNDSFELWVLLHFEDIDPALPASRQRETYYNRLTEIFRAWPNPNEYLQKALQHATFHYKKDMKSERNFRNIVRDIITRKVLMDNAIARAKALVQHHANKPPHEKAPCTLAHLLVEELIRLGGKEL